MIYKPVMKKQIRRDKTGSKESYKDLSKILVMTIVPVLLSTTIYNLSSIIDSGLFGNVMSNIFAFDEKEYSAFTKFYEQQWKETKKNIRKKHLKYEKLKGRNGNDN